MNAGKGSRKASYGRHRGDTRHGATHARTPGRPPAGDPWIGHPDPPRPDAEPSAHVDDYPSWPGRPGPYALHPDHPSWPGRPDPRWAPPPQAPPPAPPRGQRFQAAPTAPVLPVRARTDLAPRANPAPGPVLRGRVSGPVDQARQTPVPVWPQAASPYPEAVPVWDGGSVQLATWIISEANQHAADIRHEARDEAVISLAGAKQEATQLVRQASDQAAATLAAAELEAAEIRASVMKLTAELGGVAAYVTQSLYSPAAPAAKPVLPPEIAPAVKPKARQLMAIRVMTIITATLVLFAAITGVTEVALHGFAFFVFRSVGTGETGPHGLQEDQGPGQPDTPGAHQQQGHHDG
jgi:hypothetical protein